MAAQPMKSALKAKPGSVGFTGIDAATAGDAFDSSLSTLPPNGITPPMKSRPLCTLPRRRQSRRSRPAATTKNV